MSFFQNFSKFKNLTLSALGLMLIACSGCTEEEAPDASEVPTLIQLNKITDLEVTSCKGDFCTIRWTVPSSYPKAQEIQNYDVRYTDKSITNNDEFNEAIIVDTSDIEPLKPGDIEEIIIFDLQKETTYYFAIKTKNQTDQISDLSNVANGLIKSIKLNSIHDLEVTSCKQDSCKLSWTVPSSNPEAQEIQSYDVRYDNQPITSNNHFNQAVKVDTSDILPSKGGESEEFTIKGLEQDIKYYFAVKVTVKRNKNTPSIPPISF